ncbi:MAG TPA: cysteine desulfurase family protein [Bacilli bacterium]|nr:cysteine desulfurase family protein [Bacilli bacterium]
MIYLDYSATTKPNFEVLNIFTKTAANYFANPNSKYDIAKESKTKIDKATRKLSKLLGVKSSEIIYTSGASEANNMAIKGLASKEKRKHIITTPFEHSSITAPLGYLQSLGYKIDFVKIKSNGEVDLEDLERLITKDTFLVTIGAVNSELGFRQPIEKIGKMLKKYNLIFHSDITQLLGKDKFDLTNVDMASMSAHKIYGIKGIGALVKKEKINLIPLIHGGKSTTIYRSGTPSTELIVSFRKAIELLLPKVSKNKRYVQKLNKILIKGLTKYPDIKINSSDISIPQIVNFSILKHKADAIQRYFSASEVYFSTRTACSSEADISLAVYKITNDEQRAASSVRISLSHLTTIKEIKEFLKILSKYMEKKI